MRKWLIIGLMTGLMVMPMIAEAGIIEDVYNGFLGLLGINNNPEETISLTETIHHATYEEEKYSDGSTKLAFLGQGTRNVWEDEKWKPIKEAKSLKNVWKKIYLEKDKDFDIEVTEVNFTNLELNFAFDPSNYTIDELKQKYPECDSSKENDIKCDFKLTIKEDETETKFQYKYQLKNGVLKEDLKYVYKGNPLDKTYTFGGNSTTIMLQDADTENLEDTYVHGLVQYVNANFGIDDKLRVRGEGGSSPGFIYLKFNLSQVPSGQQIDNAELSLYRYSGTSSCTTCNITIYELDNQIWTEGIYDGLAGLPSWNDPVLGIGNQLNATLATTNNQWYSWEVTSWASSEYDNSKHNLSFEGRILGDTTYVYFYSKEHATTATRPYLNITYSEAAGDETPPTYSLNSTNETIVSKPCNFTLKWDDDTALESAGQYIFSTNNSGTWVNASAVTFSSTPETAWNVTVLNSTVGTLVQWKYYAKDNAGNWNTSDIYNLTTTSAIANISFTINFTGYSIYTSTEAGTSMATAQFNTSTQTQYYTNASIVADPTYQQTSLVAMLNMTHIGDTDFDLNISLNESLDETKMILFGTYNNNPNDNPNKINATGWIANSSFSPGDNQNYFIFLNFTNVATSDETQRIINITASEA